MTTKTEVELSFPLNETAARTLPPRLAPSKAQELAAVFKALGDPTRLQMASLLLRAGEQGLCVCDVVANFPLGQPTISHHLRVLREARLVTARKKGLWVYYAVNRECLGQMGVLQSVSGCPIQRSQCSDTDGDGTLVDGGED